MTFNNRMKMEELKVKIKSKVALTKRWILVSKRSQAYKGNRRILLASIYGFVIV